MSSDTSDNKSSFITVPLLVSTVVLTALATFAVGLRFYLSFSTFHRRRLLTEEWLLLAGLIFCYGSLIQNIAAGAIGGVGTTKLDEYHSAEFFTKITWIDAFMLGPANMFIKLSILAFYVRIFYPIKWFAYICYGEMALVVSWCISWVFGQLFCADPITGAWDPLHDYLVINYATFGLAIFGSDIVLDVITLALPLLVIRTLHIPAKRRWKIAAAFWLGIFCVVAASIRLYYAYTELAPANTTLKSDQDRYATLTKTAMWSRIEPNASIVAACLPLYGPLLPKLRTVDTVIRSAFSKISLRSRDGEESLSEYALHDNAGRAGSVKSENGVTTICKGDQSTAKVRAFPSNQTDEESHIGVTIEHDMNVRDVEPSYPDRSYLGSTDPRWNSQRQ